MLRPILHQQICAACRLHQAIAVKQLARSRQSVSRPLAGTRAFSRSGYRGQQAGLSPHERTGDDGAAVHATHDKGAQHSPTTAEPHGRFPGIVEDVGHNEETPKPSIQEQVRLLRQEYGDRVPNGALSEEQGRVWERLYGRPLRTIEEIDGLREEDNVEDGTGVTELRAGEWEDVEYEAEEAETSMDNEEGEADAQLQRDIDASTQDQEYDPEAFEEDLGEEEDLEEDSSAGPSIQRFHPLTVANRFATDPTTIQLPKDTLTDLIALLLGQVNSAHVTSAAHRIFGGFGLPFSTSTPRHGKVQEQKTVPLNVSQSRMSEIEADVYMAVLMCATYASTLAVLVETRKRLGTAWAESLVHKANAGTLRILDAGGAGMGVLAVRDLIKAEWERMHDDIATSSELTLAGGKTGGPGESPPLGNATAYIASDALRHRASHLLVNTTFIPRMPDYIHTETAKQSGKFDIVVAPYTIWPIREDWARKTHIENLWSLLNADGGVLCMLEKGVARGFEAIAGARDLLLRTRIATPDSQDEVHHLTADSGDIEWETPYTRDKEPGMIIAPCTNHKQCPMYYGDKKGTIKGRKDICHFSQRYIRPPFLQKILGAKDKNFEDLKFAYLSVMRGGDVRATENRPVVLQEEPVAEQNDAAVETAFKGFASEDSPVPSSLALPRTILPPIKRRGHVILDVCTPAGRLERWTVPRSFSKQAFHDARKSEWGDLWALGAKTRVGRDAKLGKHARKETQKFELSRKQKKAKRRVMERKSGKQGVLMKQAQHE